MESASALHKRAEEAEQLARVVAYAPDKARLLKQAEELRRLAEERSFASSSG
jgi:hypothetical protein